MKRKLVIITFVVVIVLTGTFTAFALSNNLNLSQVFDSVTCEKSVEINQLGKDINTYQSNIIGAQITDYENKINQLNATISNPVNGETASELLQMQVQVVQYQIEILTLQYQQNGINFSQSVSDKSIQQQMDTSKFNAGILYYNICLYKDQKSLLSTNLEYLNIV